MASAKQQLAIQIYMDNRGISVGEAMRRAGYTEATAKNPKNLTSTESWQEMMDKYLPDVELVAKHNDLLSAKKLESAVFPAYVPKETIREMLLEAGCQPRNYETDPRKGTIFVWYWAPDMRAQAAALDLAYKLKGKLKHKVEHSGEVPVALVEFLGDDGSTPGHDPVSQ